MNDGNGGSHTGLRRSCQWTGSTAARKSEYCYQSVSSDLNSSYAVKTKDAGDRKEPKWPTVGSSHPRTAPTRCVTFVGGGRSSRKFLFMLTLQNNSPTWFRGFRRRLRHWGNFSCQRIRQKARVALFSPKKGPRSERSAVTDKEEVQPQFKTRKSSTAHAQRPTSTFNIFIFI